MSQDALLYELLNESSMVAAPDDVDPYAKVPLPPEGTHRFKIARRGKCELRFKQLVQDASGKFKANYYSFDQLKAEATKKGIDVRQLAAEPTMARLASLNVILCCDEPSMPWDGSVSFLELTSDIRSEGEIGELPYFLRRLGHQVPGQIRLVDLMDLADRALPEGDPDNSPVTLDVKVQWWNYYKNKDGQTKYVRGMKKWPLIENPPVPDMHSNELTIEGLGEPLQAKLRIDGYGANGNS